MGRQHPGGPSKVAPSARPAGVLEKTTNILAGLEENLPILLYIIGDLLARESKGADSTQATFNTSVGGQGVDREVGFEHIVHAIRDMV